MPAPNGAIPVESILKLTLDKSGASTIQDFLDKQETSWGNIEKYVGRIGSHIEGMTRFGLGLAGVAGVGAVVSNFMGVSQAGSNLGLAAGHVTGGAGVWHGYGQAMLGAQARTGVAAGDIAQGLIMAVQAVGGSPSPSQAAVIGGLLAGYGQTVGLSPSQVSQVIAPILQASNRPLTAGSLLGLGATLSGTLTAFPGSQAAPMLGLVSSLGVSQALGSGPARGFATDVHGLAAIVNAAAQTNSIFRNPSITGGATGAISGGLQNAYGNPAMEAFLQRAGISYGAQRQGITPGNAQAIMHEATSMYGTGITRDLALRSMFGLQGADLLEALSTPAGQRNLHQSLLHHGSVTQTLHNIHHAQAGTTPSATANRFGGSLLHWLEASPLHALLGIGGILGGPKLLGKGAGLAGKGLSRLLRGGGSSAAEDAGAAGVEDVGGSALADVLGAGALRLLGPVGVVAGVLGFPDSAGGPQMSGTQIDRNAVVNVLNMASRKFGAHNIHSAAARNWMQSQLYGMQHGHSLGGVWGLAAMDEYGGHPAHKFRGQAGQMLDEVLGDQYARNRAAAVTGGQDPTLLFAQGAKELLQAAQMLSRGKFSSYTPGSSSAQAVSWLGASGVQALGAAAPGMEFASLLSGGSGGGSGGGSLFASFTGGGGGGGGGVVGGGGGAGWQPCTLTWYDPALGGTNSGSGRADPNSPTASGQPYSPTAYTCAAPSQYAFGTVIAFSYGGKAVQCVVNDRGGAISGSHFDLSRGAAQALGMISAGVVKARFHVVRQGTGHAGKGGGSGGGSGGSGAPGGAGGGGASGGRVPDMVHALAAGAGASPVVQQVHHHHIYVDGRELRNQRVLRGHHR